MCPAGKEGGDEEGEDTYGMLRKLAQLQRMAGRQPSGGNGGGDAAAAGEAGAGEGSGGGGGASLDAASASLAETTVQAGCTAVVALIVKDRLYVANAGDSRAVLCRGGKALAMSGGCGSGRVGVAGCAVRDAVQYRAVVRGRVLIVPGSPPSLHPCPTHPSRGPQAGAARRARAHHGGGRLPV